jgi:hypothetical protein
MRAMASVRDPERAARRREWLARALFESALILLGIVGAFAVNQWQESRDRHIRRDALMTAVRAELQSNLRLMEDASAYNTEVVGRFRRLEAEKATSIPAGTHPRGLMVRPQLVSAAWDAAQAGGIVNDLPVETTLIIARVHEGQRDYVEATARLLDVIYAALFQQQSAALTNPGLLAGVLNDYASRGRGLIERYRTTLDYLNAP